MYYKNYTLIIFSLIVLTGTVVLSFRYVAEINVTSNSIEGTINASLITNEQNERQLIQNEEQTPPFVSEHISGGNPPPPYGWTLQSFPPLPGKVLTDFVFVDSLTGFATASPDQSIDSAYILKTTNGGFNWIKINTSRGRLIKIIFINSQTGFAGGSYLLKTSNGGNSWTEMNRPNAIIGDMQIFTENEIMLASSSLVVGGVFRTTNGGISWVTLANGMSWNAYPDKLYFYNSRIGFAYQIGNNFGYRTTDGGNNWIQITSFTFQTMQFLDSLNGYKASQGVAKTTNGGINWIDFELPNVINTYTCKCPSHFKIINNNTIYAAGGYIQYGPPNYVYRGIIYKTTNGGINWGYQVPDTSFGIRGFDYVYVINNNVWSYDNFYNKGIYSSTGGDSTIYTLIQSNNSEIPNTFSLEQNYPNPFNPSTKILFSVTGYKLTTNNIQLSVYDILGKEIASLVNEKLTPGTYTVDWNASGFSSGVYFYRLTVDEFSETKRMLLIK